MNYSLFDESCTIPTRQMAFFSQCQAGLHAFYRSPFTGSDGVLCRNCKSSIVDWELSKTGGADNIELIAEELKKEWWRLFWWETEINETDLKKAISFSHIQMRERVEKRICSSVGKVYDFKGKLKPYNDGYQTPFSGNVIYYAQHAMATCCRECIECWYGIPNGRELTTEELNYLSELTLYYIQKRVRNV